MDKEHLYQHDPKHLAEFQKYFELYYDGLRSFIYYKTGDANLAEDIAQDAFIKVWGMWDKIKTETIKSFLYKIAENLYKNYYKHKQVEFKFANKYENNEKGESPQFLLEKEEFNQHLQKTLAEIPERNRVVFLMNRMEDLTYNEIADRLNITVKAVEKRMQKAIEVVKRKIKYKI